ncbi:hypothetical protein A9G28_12190 [Gilliamella sp. Fer1-1]|jgi:environmental stress-induced protein Ves|uniref:hypothetical protein n=1 Tax=Gilliamella sp. Fer1-1 TaxID=3120240 RepID=UPI00080E43E0|nr:hypothetical protein [Gilliamella apicola]OCG45478.1 hypothetical protein A9G28_12190 [Gilliamella apicola]
MPYINLYISENNWDIKEKIINSIDEQIVKLKTFDNKLCKYRLIKIQEYNVIHNETRCLQNTSTIRCEFTTFNDRSEEALQEILMSCQQGLKNVSRHINNDLKYSTLIRLMGRTHHISN